VFLGNFVLPIVSESGNHRIAEQCTCGINAVPKQ